jgi:hypothetical protein
VRIPAAALCVKKEKKKNALRRLITLRPWSRFHKRKVAKAMTACHLSSLVNNLSLLRTLRLSESNLHPPGRLTTNGRSAEPCNGRSQSPRPGRGRETVIHLGAVRLCLESHFWFCFFQSPAGLSHQPCKAIHYIHESRPFYLYFFSATFGR